MDNEGNVGERLKTLREAKGLSQRELARLSGVDRGRINKLENEGGEITTRTARALARPLGVSPAVFLEGEQAEPVKSSLSSLLRELGDRIELVDVPLMGLVPAGYPADESQQPGETISVPKELLGASADRKDLFALTVSGESLAGDEIHDHDAVVIEPTTTIIEGKIYLVRLGNESAIRHVFKTDDHLRLVSSNGEYQEIAATDVLIAGRVLASGKWKRH